MPLDYIQVALKDLINEIGEEETKIILSDFSCKKEGMETSLNCDVEDFLHNKAKIFEECDFARTHTLFVRGDKGKLILVGYYSIAQKQFEFKKGVSIKKRKEIAGHHFFKDGPLPAILIGQLGKNYSETALNGVLISGREILHYALLNIKEVYKTSPFRLIYIECKDHPSLRTFYEKHGFTLHADTHNVPFVNQTGLIMYFAPVAILSSLS